MLTLGKWLRRYAVLIILIVAFGQTMISVLLYGMGPMPQLPPTGYEIERGTVVLQWNKGNIDEPITLQVSDSPEFEDTLFERELGGVTHSLKIDYERGQTYYWRLMQNDVPSPVSNFNISEYHVNL